MEVCYNGNYHPVCDEGWSDNDAIVACNTVGYSSDFYRKSNPKHYYHTIATLVSFSHYRCESYWAARVWSVR